MCIRDRLTSGTLLYQQDITWKRKKIKIFINGQLIWVSLLGTRNILSYVQFLTEVLLMLIWGLISLIN